jgi:sulfide dehydrogenase cytochrome subunit
MIRSVAASGLLALAVSVSCHAFADETAPPVLAASCVACHGTGGKSATGIPPISGHTVEELKTAMLAFRDGTAPATVMDRIARGYTDTEIDALAAEISKWTN